MSAPRCSVRSMPGPSGLARGVPPILLALFLSAAVSLALLAGSAWAQPGGVTVRAGGEEATGIADHLQQGGGPSDLLIATGNVEIIRGPTPRLSHPAEL